MFQRDSITHVSLDLVDIEAEHNGMDAVMETVSRGWFKGLVSHQTRAYCLTRAQKQKDETLRAAGYRKGGRKKIDLGAQVEFFF